MKNNKSTGESIRVRLRVSESEGAHNKNQSKSKKQSEESNRSLPNLPNLPGYSRDPDSLFTFTALSLTIPTIIRNQCTMTQDVDRFFYIPSRPFAVHTNTLETRFTLHASRFTANILSFFSLSFLVRVPSQHVHTTP